MAVSFLDKKGERDENADRHELLRVRVELVITVSGLR
jgi:hypothetical protein